MLETSARLLRLLTLLQARPDWPGAELAGRLGVTPRTLRRDVQRLRDLDYPVRSVPGVAGGYRLGSGTALPPVQPDDDEAIAVVVSLRSATSHTVTGLAEASVSALAKLDQMLPARLRDRTAALQQATVALAGPVPAIDVALLTALAAACRGHQRVRLRYRDRGGTESVRAIEPYRLVTGGYRWYLMAFDLDKNDWRTFRVDRISEPDLRGRFTPRDPPEPTSFVGTAITTAPYRYQARCLLHAAVDEVAGQVAPTVGVLTADGPDRCVLSTGSDSLDAIVFHLLGLGVEFTVLEPAELIDRLNAIADQLSRAASVPDPATPGGRAPNPGQAGRPPR